MHSVVPKVKHNPYSDGSLLLYVAILSSLRVMFNTKVPPIKHTGIVAVKQLIKHLFHGKYSVLMHISISHH